MAKIWAGIFVALCGLFGLMVLYLFVTEPPGLPDHDQFPTFAGLQPLADETDFASFEQRHSRTYTVVEGDLCTVLSSSIEVMVERGADELLDVDVEATCSDPDARWLWNTSVDELLWSFHVDENEPELVVALGVSRFSSF